MFLQLIQRPIIGQATPTNHFPGSTHLASNRSGNVFPHLPPPSGCSSLRFRSSRSVAPFLYTQQANDVAFIAAVPLVLGESYVLIMFFTKGFLLGPAGLDLFDAVSCFFRTVNLEVELMRRSSYKRDAPTWSRRVDRSLPPVERLSSSANSSASLCPNSAP